MKVINDSAPTTGYGRNRQVRAVPDRTALAQEIGRALLPWFLSGAPANSSTKTHKYLIYMRLNQIRLRFRRKFPL